MFTSTIDRYVDTGQKTGNVVLAPSPRVSTS